MDQSRVNIYGDSIMRGTVIDEKQRYHSTVGQHLKWLSDCFGLIFKSRAHFGITIDKGRQYLEKDLAKGLDCDFAVVEYGGNDCSFRWDEVARDPNRDHQPLTSLEDFEKHCTAMTAELRRAGVTPVLMTLPPIDAVRHLEFISPSEAGKKNILSWLGDVQMIYRFHELYSRTIEKIAVQTQTLLVDVRSRFLGRHDLKNLVGADGVHLSGEGYRVMADTFADFVAARRRDPSRLVFE